MVRVIFALTLLLFVLIPELSTAEVFTVTTTTDAPDAAHGDRRCDTGRGLCSLRAAVEEAEALLGEAHTIVLPTGVFHLRIRGRAEDFSFTGDLDIRGNITVVGTSVPPALCPLGCMGTPGAGTAINANAVDRIFDVHEGGRLALRNVVVRNGSVVDPADSTGAIRGEAGGAIRNHGEVSLDNVVLTDNVAATGGALWNRGNAQLRQVAITDNMATVLDLTGDFRILAGGGGIDSRGTLAIAFGYIADNISFAQGGGIVADFAIGSEPGGVMLFDTHLLRNRAPFGGGAFLATTGSALRVHVDRNEAFAGNGGGLFMLTSRGIFTIEDSTITNNRAVDPNSRDCPAPEACGHGGGIRAQSTRLLRTSIAGNRADGNGGGAVLRDSLIEDSTVSGNTAFRRGGGVVLEQASVAAFNNGLINSTVSGNRAERAGGGIYAPPMGGGRLQFTTIARNFSPSAGDGLYVDTSVVIELKANLLAENGAANCVFNSTPFSAGWNRWDRTTHDACSARLRAVGDRAGNPSLGALRDNGGPTLTHDIGAFSIARDVLAPVDCTVPTVARVVALAADQRGVVRPQSTHCDSGAVETTAAPILIWVRVRPELVLSLDLALSRAVTRSTEFEMVLTKAQAFDGLETLAELKGHLAAAQKALDLMVVAQSADEGRARFAALGQAIDATDKPFQALEKYRTLDAVAYERLAGSLADLDQLLTRIGKRVK